MELFESLVSNAKQTNEKPAFILLGGDLIAHGLNTDSKMLKQSFKNVTAPLEAAFPNTSIYITLGNNDFASDYGSFDTDADNFKTAYKVFGKWMNDEQSKTFLKGGYYYADFPEVNLRFLFLNSVMYAAKRDQTQHAEDPYDQFAWIESSYDDAVQKGFKVSVALHIPPGVYYYKNKLGWNEDYITKFSKIMKKCDFSFILSGHSHTDMFLPLYSPTADKDSVLYSLSAPSVSPVNYNNPGYRVFELSNGIVKDYTQYYADLLMNPSVLKWQVEYKFSDAYSASNVTRETINNAAEWVRTTGEGQWRYRERIYTRADEHNAFYYCALKALLPDDIVDCENKLNIDKLSAQPYYKKADFLI